ncbi:MAG TPA: SPFH domain-containing protein [Phycisphaerales bacterium]|nr:SPFH domain-containing protein [Phycisphaerales bacterium]
MFFFHQPTLALIPSLGLGTWALIITLAIAWFVLLGVRRVPNNRAGIVEKRFGLAGSVRSGLIALNREAGFQPAVLRGGLHWLMPLQYRVHIVPLVTIPQNKIGYVFARDGRPLDHGQTLASNVEANSFEDAAVFLRAGGQRGPQRKILREGTYAINLAQFVVLTEEQLYFLPLAREDVKLFHEMASLIDDRDGFDPIVIKGMDDLVGIVTVHDGPALDDGQIIAPIVGAGSTGPLAETGTAASVHNNFQDPEAFLHSGGRRGRQAQVLVEGTYYINRVFATVEFIRKTTVDVGFVGVVVSYTGQRGTDLSGTDYSHGELVRRGERGVWSEALLPGKYAFNTYAGKVIPVPTTNFLLKWISSETSEHRFDEHLTEVSLITRDAFEPSLPLSVVVHIDYRKAPLVIQRFGDIQRLVEQTLDPMVSAYFKNVAQTRTLIQLLQERAQIQDQAGSEMRAKFGYYNLDLEEVLIGTPKSAKGESKLETILEQLRTRQVAQERIETYAQQERAAVKERELREAEARAGQQSRLTESEIAITVQTNQGKADYQRSLQQAAQVKAMADAEASKVRMMAEAEAERAARVGVAQAMAVEEQVRAYGGPVYQLTSTVMERFAQAIQESGVDMVPKIVIGGSTTAGGNGHAGGDGHGGPLSRGGGSGSVVESLLTILLSERMLEMANQASKDVSPQAAAIRGKILTGLEQHKSGHVPMTATVQGPTS